MTERHEQRTIVRRGAGIGFFVSLAAFVVVPAHAQVPGTGAPGVRRAAPAIPSAGATPSPFLSPAANPYLNPYLSTPNQTMSGETALLFMLSAQNASGGIGSGRMSGVKQLEEGTAPAGTAALDSRRGADPRTRPGYRRYFQRGLHSGGSGSPGERVYFQRGQGRFDR